MATTLNYPSDFRRAIQAVFSPRIASDRAILTALEENHFQLGGMLFNYAGDIVIDLESMEMLLSGIVSSKGCLSEEQNVRVQSAHDILKKKREVKDLHKRWMMIYEYYQSTAVVRKPTKPCKVEQFNATDKGFQATATA